MSEAERELARKVRAMTKAEIILKAMQKQIRWVDAARILGVTDRHMRRLKLRYEKHGYDGIRDCRGGRPRRKRIPIEAITKILKLREQTYAAYNVKHFHEKLREEHQIDIGYTWTKKLLQEAGLAPKEVMGGVHRRKRERRPMKGMMVHMDASTHEWILGVPPQDLVVCLDDADGEMLYARFFPQEGTYSTLHGIDFILVNFGRFSEFYTDKGSHFCHTPTAGAPSTTDHDGQVSRALKALGIRQILANSPQARGRSERAFLTLQGRLPNELATAGIKTYEAANEYLDTKFKADFNRHFKVKPAQEESAFVPLVGVELKFLLSIQHERVVNADNTVSFNSLKLQLMKSATRAHFARCPVTVCETMSKTIAVVYQGKCIGEFTYAGELIAGNTNPQVSHSQQGSIPQVPGLPSRLPSKAVHKVSTKKGRNEVRKRATTT
jgi:transposase